MKRVQTMEERFWKKVNKTPTCWLWTGTVTPKGHGYIRRPNHGPLVGTHRYSWELHFGTVPDGMWVLHTCDVANCVRPDHLYLGDVVQNNKDIIDRKRHASFRITHCPQGHEYTPDNIYLSNNRRTCKKCAVERAQARKASA